MLWSLLKMVLFFAVVAGLTIGAGYLLDFDGGVRIALGATEFNLGAFQAAVVLVLLLLGFWILLKLVGLFVAFLRFLNGDETAMSRYVDRNRERRGHQALIDALQAMASGEGPAALRSAERAERFLHQPELTNLLTAQAAELAGDSAKAEAVYKALLKDDNTKFVGVRGILKQRLEAGDTDTAMQLAERAFALRPKHEETQDILLNLQAKAEDWAGARKTLAAKLSTGTLPRDVHRRRDAVLALSQARAEHGPDAAISSEEEAIEANRLSPDLVPAAVMAAEAHIANDKPRLATRVIKKAWDAAPHPELAAAFAAIEPNETPEARVKRFQPLLSTHVMSEETKLLKAELLIAAEDFPAARRAMGDLAETTPTKRSLTMMAAIERGEGSDDAVVKAWLAKAMTASPGPQWVCGVTGKVYPKWVPYTDGGFDTLTWKRLDGGEEAGLSGNAEGMLPMIVGQPDIAPAGGAADTDSDPIDADVIDATPAKSGT